MPCVHQKWQNRKRVYISVWKLRIFLYFPGGAVDKNLPANARDKGSVSGPGRFHTPWSREACAPQFLKPAHLEPVLHNQRSHYKEKYTYHNEEWPRSPQPAEARVKQLRPGTATNKIIFFKRIYIRIYLMCQCLVHFSRLRRLRGPLSI